MRLAPLLLSTFLLAGCKREAQEAAAQAKGAAAQARSAADQAAASARSAAEQARTATDDAAARARATLDQARAAAAGAGDSARQGLDSAGKSLKELAAGDQLEGELVSSGGTELTVRPRSGTVETLHTDARTRWILHGAAAGKEGFGTGAPVRVTYIVQDGQRLATQIEAIAR